MQSSLRFVPAGRRQPPPNAREYSYAKQLSWDYARAGVLSLLGAQVR